MTIAEDVLKRIEKERPDAAIPANLSLELMGRGEFLRLVSEAIEERFAELRRLITLKT